MVEGGAEVLGSSWPRRLFDEVALFRAPLLLGGRGSRPAFGGPDPLEIGTPSASSRVPAARRPFPWPWPPRSSSGALSDRLRPMFTGIVEGTGTVRTAERRGDVLTRADRRGRRSSRGCRSAASIAVNGCCLTAVAVGRATASTCELTEETLRRTRLRRAAPARARS